MGEESNGREVLIPPRNGTLSLDLDFITRNVRDLSKTAQFAHLSELEELHQMAYQNLKVQLGPDKPLAVDPQLALEAYKTLSSVVIQVVETKRKAADTLIKARNLVDVPSLREHDFLGDSEDEDGPEEGLSLSEEGVFGGLGTTEGSADASLQEAEVLKDIPF